jgi:hypothetical protein
MNLINTTEALPLLNRYRAINLFSHAVNYTVFTVILYCVVILTFISLCVSVSAKNVSLNFSARCLKSIHKLLRGLKGDRSESLLGFEIKKLLMFSAAIFLIPVLLAGKLFFTEINTRTDNSISEACYEQYISKLAGTYTEEKAQYLRQERESIDEAIFEDATAWQRFANGEITENEYNIIIQKGIYARLHNTPLAKVEEQAKYLAEHAALTGITGGFLNPDGYEKMFFGGFDYFLYLLLTVIISFSFSMEFTQKSSSGAFINLLHTTKNGRKHTFYAKLDAVMIVSFVISVLFCFVDFMFVTLRFGLPLTELPLCSLKAFSALDGNLSIGAYIAIFYTLRIIMSLLFSVAVFCASFLLKHTIPILITTLSLLIVPSLIGMLVLPRISDFTPTALFSVNALFTKSIKCDLYGDFGLFTLYFMVFISIVIILLTQKKNFCKTKS